MLFCLWSVYQESFRPPEDSGVCVIKACSYFVLVKEGYQDVEMYKLRKCICRTESFNTWTREFERKERATMYNAEEILVQKGPYTVGHVAGTVYYETVVGLEDHRTPF